jgi:hypothetical protein
MKNVVRTLVVGALVALCAPLWTVPAAIAQTSLSDQQLVARLVDIVRRKGDKDYPLGKVCGNLGLEGIGSCLVYQSGYVGTETNSVMKDDNGHAFNFYTDPKTQGLHIIVFKTNPRYGEFYLIDLDASLLRAAKREGKGADAVWSPLQNEQAATGYAGELRYWRAQLPVLQREPERKE